MAKLDGPMTCGYGIDARDAPQKNQRCGAGAVAKIDHGGISVVRWWMPCPKVRPRPVAMKTC